METLASKINVEEFKSWLTQSKTTKELFRWPTSYEDAKIMLRTAYAEEVQKRGMVCESNEKTLEYLDKIAEMMTTRSTKCGILLCGNCGNGKTTSMNAFLSVTKFLSLVASKGRSWGVISTSARRITQVAKDEACMNDAKTVDVLCIDDVGLEPTEVLDFGNAINPVIEILEQRYRDQLFTFITTNLTPKQIREKYGDRIADRFNEIMKCIVYENPTFRR